MRSRAPNTYMYMYVLSARTELIKSCKDSFKVSVQLLDPVIFFICTPKKLLEFYILPLVTRQYKTCATGYTNSAPGSKNHRKIVDFIWKAGNSLQVITF